MTTRAVAYLLIVLVVGVLAGSGLAGLADAPPNDPCLDTTGRTEGGGALELWPFGVRCRYVTAGSGETRSEFFGPTTAELYAWIAAATLLAAAALLRRDSAFVRGAATLAFLLAFYGAVWQYAGGQIALSASVVLGVPLAFALDRRLRPPGTRSLGASLYVAIALAALAFCAIFGVIAFPVPAIVIAVLGGGLVSARLARPQRQEASPTTT